MKPEGKLIKCDDPVLIFIDFLSKIANNQTTDNIMSKT